MTSNAFEVARQTFVLLMPEILLLLAAISMMTLGAFVKLPRRAWCATAAVAHGVALIALLGAGSQAIDPYSSVVAADAFATYGRVLFLLTGLVLLGLGHDQVDDERAAEFFGALMLINAGAMLVAASQELVILFVGLELVSIPTYLLLYLPRRTRMTLEAATKYFYLSILASALMLLGLAYLYGMTGLTNLRAMAYLTEHGTSSPQSLALLALVFVMAGLAFRVAAVPLHFYAPDVYQGSPLVVAALLSWIPKGIGYVAMLRVFVAIVPTTFASGTIAHQAVLLAWTISVASMVLGNTVALAQDNLKRLLAYSSIAHAGYIMIGVAVMFSGDGAGTGLYFGAEAVLFYLTAYALMTLGAFGALLLLNAGGRAIETVDDLAGLSRTEPGWALALAICLFSLAGIPPLAGFWGKFELFAAAFAASDTPDGRLLWWLAVVGVLTSAAGAFYYLKIIMVMYLRQPTGEVYHPRFGWPTGLAVGTCAALTLLMGLYPAPIIHATREAAVAVLVQPEPAGAPEYILPPEKTAQAVGPTAPGR